jgi:glycosyltransferase involved in cell wall biosynthesis
MPHKIKGIGQDFDVKKRDYSPVHWVRRLFQAYYPGPLNVLDDLNGLGAPETQLGSGLRVLYVLHNSPFHDDNFIRGGSEYHVLDLIRHNPQNLCFVLYLRTLRRRLLVLEVWLDGQLMRFQFRLSKSPLFYRLHDPVFALWLAECLRRLRIDVVHIQHWLRLSLDVFDVPRKLGIPYFITLHDYYALCPNERLLTPQNRFCQLKRTPDQCGRCLWQSKKQDWAFLQRWQAEMGDALRAASRVFAPSGYVKGLARTVYPQIPVTVIPHGLDTGPAIKEEGVCAAWETHSAGQPKKLPEIFHVAVLGHLQPVKGSRLLSQILCLNQDETIKIHSFGQILDRTLLKRSGRQPLPLIAHGAYEREHIVELLRESEIHLVLILSILPETFSFTLSEALLAGCPVLALDLGAVGERIRAAHCGWLLPPDATAEYVLGQIQWIRAHPEEYFRARQAIRNIGRTSGEAMARTYQAHYRSVL